MLDASELRSLLFDAEDPDDQVMIKFFVPDRIIGEGAFSTVISAYDELSQSQVAIKILNKKGFKSSQIDMLKRESAILNKLNHPNIVRLKMSKETKSKIFLVMEEIKGVSLEEYIIERKAHHKPLTDREIKSITIQMVRAIKYFHEKDIIHRDFKPENILIFEQQVKGSLELTESQQAERKLRVKIIDFGLSIQLQTQKYQPLNDNCGTLLYMAPEVALRKEYNRSVDIWSLGVVVFTMFSMGRHPFWAQGGETKKSYIDKIKNLQWAFWPENMDKQACNFITKTTARRSEYRMTAQQCLRHPWLLGEGEISDPITMGDMIANFSNMQNLARLTKALLFMKYLIQKMDAVGAVAIIKTHPQWKTGQTEETDRDRGTAQGSFRQSFDSTNSNLIRINSNMSHSDHDQEQYRDGQCSQQNYKVSNGSRHTRHRRMKITQARKSQMQPVLPNSKPQNPQEHSNSTGQINVEKKNKFGLNLNPRRSMRVEASTVPESEKIENTNTKLPDDPTIEHLPMIQSTLQQKLENVHGEKMFQSIVFQTSKKELISKYKDEATMTPQPVLIKQKSKKQVPSVKLPQIRSKPPLMRNSIQFLQEDNLTQSPANSPISAGQASRVSQEPKTNNPKSYFSKLG